MVLLPPACRYHHQRELTETGGSCSRQGQEATIGRGRRVPVALFGLTRPV